MKLNGWRRLWVVVSIIIFLVIAFFTIMLFPKKSEIISRWAYETIEVVKKPGESSFDIREAYRDYSDKELIDKIHEKYIGRSLLAEIKFEKIDEKYKNELMDLPKKQAKHVLIGLAIYLCLTALIYIFGWSVFWIYRGFKSKKVDL